jgi:DNA invertase Pin-like site-specific DNA recombinase
MTEQKTVLHLKEAVAYARYSTEKQSKRSIDDQFSLLEKIAKQHGYKIVEFLKDEAIAGSGTLGRAGWLKLMRMVTAKNSTIGAVFIESCSRMSRDLADTARDFKRITHRQRADGSHVELIDLEGPLNTMRIGMSGIMNQEFRKHLGNMMRRAWDGRVKDGLMPGKPAYGHRKVAGTSFEREIDPDAAKIINRIFIEYANLEPVRGIAAGLNRDGILSPSGGKWNHTVFIAGGGNGKGIIGNRIYIGENVWNQNRSVISIETEKRCKEKGKPEDLLTVSVPHLRIIDQDLWDRAQQVRTGRSRQGSAVRVYKKSIVNHILAGRLTCGACGGDMKIVWSKAGEHSRIGCTNSRNKGLCDNSKSYDLVEIEATVLHGIKHDLDVKALMAYTEGAHKEWAKRQRAASGEREVVERALNRVIEKRDRIVSAMTDPDMPLEPLKVKYKEIELERAGLADKLRMIEADGGGGNVVTLHPAMIRNFRTNIETMHTALTDTKLSEAELAPFRVAFGNVFDRIVVHPTGKRRPVEVTPYARISAIMGVDILPKMRTAKEVLEEQGLTTLVLATHGTLEQLGW